MSAKYHSNRYSYYEKKTLEQSTPSKKKKTAQKLQKKKQIQKKKRQVRVQRTLIELGLSLFFLGVFLYGLSIFTFSITKVEGYSMIPTLNNSEWVFVNKLAKPRRFKLVLYKDLKSKETSVRRVIGLPGETIFYRKDKLYVNNQEVYERFIEEEVQRAKDSKSNFTEDWSTKKRSIPKGEYLVLGDNRPYAADSRDYGYITEKEIVGVVEMRILPVHQIKQF
ncbi:signal peptidase I [Enterococcus sp. DIV0724b]|uniref:signal peptidase I n=1 Tax=Enterococcus sp. DIV0724b TaxID=2774694 RepID=UPI003D2FD76E